MDLVPATFGSFLVLAAGGVKGAKLGLKVSSRVTKADKGRVVKRHDCPRGNQSEQTEQFVLNVTR